MAFPFAKAPQLIDYMRWAQGQGCECPSGYDAFTGSTFVSIIAPSGLRVTIPSMPQTERLTARFIAHLDRRLGLSSPFLSIDAPDD